MMIVKSNRARDGFAVGGPANFGYKLVNKQYVQDPVEAGVVSYIFDAVLNGRSYAEIAESLDALGFKSRTGNKFSFSTIHGILNNERNYGMSIYNDKKKRKDRKRVSKLVFDEVKNDTAIVEPIVSKEDFDRVQELLKSRAIPKVKQLNKPYILTGILTCSHCGSLMTGDSRSSGKSKSRIRAYVCKNNKLKGDGSCSNPYVNADHLERFVKHQVKQIYDNHATFCFEDYLLVDFKAKHQNLIDTTERKNQFNNQTIDQLVLTYSLTKSDTIKTSLEKQISDIKKQVDFNESRIAIAKSSLVEIDEVITKIRGLSSEELFVNPTHTIELFRDLGLKVSADKQSVELDIQDEHLD
jgi:site-specific DNA recombinase